MRNSLPVFLAALPFDKAVEEVDALAQASLSLDESAEPMQDSLTTTNIYAEVDLEMKVKAIAHCEVKGPKGMRHWRDNPGLMSFLRSL